MSQTSRWLILHEQAETFPPTSSESLDPPTSSSELCPAASLWTDVLSSCWLVSDLECHVWRPSVRCAPRSTWWYLIIKQQLIYCGTTACPLWSDLKQYSLFDASNLLEYHVWLLVCTIPVLPLHLLVMALEKEVISSPYFKVDIVKYILIYKFYIF